MLAECSYIKPVGGKCGGVALRGKTYCHFHTPERLRAARQASSRPVKVRYFLELPMPESRGAILAAIIEVVRRLGASEMDTGHGGRLLYALELASRPSRRGMGNAVLSPPAIPGRRCYQIARSAGFRNIYQTVADAGSTTLPPKS